MLVPIKNDQEIELMKIAGKINYETHQLIEQNIRSGITTKELDQIAADFIASKNARPSFKDYQEFPGSICISINDEVVHGIPGKRSLKNGDVVSIDIGVEYLGMHSDSANTYVVGNVSKEKKALVDNTKKALFEGIKLIKEGTKLSEISKAIEDYAKQSNLGIVKELVGHGVGHDLHEDPDIPNYTSKDFEDITLKSGMTLAIEPMLTLGSPAVGLESDEWTIVTLDESASAHFEHTVLVTKDGYIILTGE